MWDKMVNTYLYTRYERFWHWLQICAQPARFRLRDSLLLQLLLQLPRFLLHCAAERVEQNNHVGISDSVVSDRKGGLRFSFGT